MASRSYRALAVIKGAEKREEFDSGGSTVNIEARPSLATGLPVNH